MSSRTCLSLINDPSYLNNYQKLSVPLLQPVQYVDDDNNIQNLYTADGQIQCGIPTYAQSLFKVDGNFMNVSQKLFWDNDAITSDRSYTFTSCNTISPNNANIISPSILSSELNDSYYNLYSDEINTIISYCNLIKQYNANIVEMKREIASNLDMKSKIDDWNTTTVKRCAIIEQDRNTHLNNLNTDTKKSVASTFNDYSSKVKSYNAVYSTLTDASNFIPITCTQYKFVEWDGTENPTPGNPSFPSCGDVPALRVAPPPPATDNTIRSKLRDNYCVDVSGGSMNSMASVWMYDCANPATPNQQWTMDSKRRLVSKNSGMCLNVNGASTTDGAQIIQYPCDEETNQFWTFNADGTLRPDHAPNKCLDVYQLATNSGSVLDLWACNGGKNQQFYQN